jgi:leader peptidase (prepilin peptidase) / N-methyltransferase
MPHLLYIPFLFALGACVGSFLNVVVYRLPRSESLISPPSHCPHCGTKLSWRDNIPVLGWILLAGKCRYCRRPISPRYPIVEAVTALLFVFYYVAFFIFHLGPVGMTNLPDQWPIYSLYMALAAGLLAASLIDAQLFIIPAGIPWWLAAVAIVVHAFADRPGSAGSLVDPPFALALAAGAGAGLILSIILLQSKILPISFPVGDLLETERAELEKRAQQAADAGEQSPEIPEQFSPAQVRSEIRKEMLFLMPPLVLAAASLAVETHVPAAHLLWRSAARIDWLNAALGSLLGGLVGAFVVWLTRILGSYVIGKEAMGLGDVHLMLGVGAVLGAGPATVTFFIAPFIGILAGLYLLVLHSRRQLPYGPYLSLAAGFVMLFYPPIAAYLQPGLQAVLWLIRQTFGG